MQCYYAAPLAFTESLRTTAVSEGCVFLYQLFLAGVVAAFSGLNRRSFLILSESLLSLWPFPYSIYLDSRYFYNCVLVTKALFCIHTAFLACKGCKGQHCHKVEQWVCWVFLAV